MIIRQSKKTLLLLLLSVLAFHAGAQHMSRVYYEPEEKFARYCVMFKNYTEGLFEYQRLLERDSNNVTYRYNIGLCHVNLNNNREEAIPWLEWVVKQPKYDVNAWYHLGRAYLYCYELDKAEKAFRKHIQLYKGKDEFEVSSHRYLEMIANANELMNNPINISLQNLGPTINTPYPEYGAYITADEKMILFNSQRFGNTGNFQYYDGKFTSDIWTSQFREGKWRRARRFSPMINSALIEELVSMSPDGSRILLFFNNYHGENMLFYSQRRGKSWKRPEFTGPVINSDHDEYGACITSDNQTIFLASNRPGGYGKKDLYFSRRLPSGQWGPAENLGNHINSPYDEDMPFLAPDGVTLYFCSRGHNSMGDYDLFKTTWDRVKNTFSEPVNLGYPLNTTWDDRTISFSQSGRYAYISTNRGDGQGDLDIYRVIFQDVPPVLTIMRGTMLDADSVSLAEIHRKRREEADKFNSKLYEDAAKRFAKKDSAGGNKILEKLILIDPELDAVIKVYDRDSGREFGTYRPNNYTGNYLVILPPGHFRIVFAYSGYENFEIESLMIEDRDTRETQIVDHIFLDKTDTPKKGRHSRQEIDSYYQTY